MSAREHAGETARDLIVSGNPSIRSPALCVEFNGKCSRRFLCKGNIKSCPKIGRFTISLTLCHTPLHFVATTNRQIAAFLDVHMMKVRFSKIHAAGEPPNCASHATLWMRFSWKPAKCLVSSLVRKYCGKLW